MEISEKYFKEKKRPAPVQAEGYEFGKPFVREDPAWYNFASDPLFWMLEKINRPQQALFGYMHATMTDESSYEAVKDAFLHGKRTEAYKVLDDLGLKGQAGHFDPIEDTIGVAVELLLDPINLIGVGAFAKFGKVIKAGDEAADVAKYVGKSKTFTDTIDKLGGVDELIRKGVVPPGDLGTRTLMAAENMMGPDAFSHYINLGWGRFKTSIPGSNILLEKGLIGPGKALRRGVKGFLSTIPETESEAILKALMDTSERVISGAQKRIANIRRIVGPKWASKLSRAVEMKDKTLLKGASDKVMETYEDLVWFGEYAPEIEQLSGMMTRKLGEVEPGKVGRSLEDTLNTFGIDDEQSQLGYILHAMTKGSKDYLGKNDIRYLAKKPVGWKGEFRPRHLSQLPRDLPGDITTINTRYGAEGIGKFTLHPRGELESLYLKRPDLRRNVGDVAKFMESGFNKKSRLWPKVRAQIRKIGEGLGEKPKPKYISFEDWLKRTPEKGEILNDAKKLMDSHRYPDPLFASFSKNFKDVSSAMRKQWDNYLTGKEMTEDAYKALWNTYLDSPNGTKWAKALFKDASHRQHFDKFMEDDALHLLGVRTGRHYRARVTAEVIDQMMDNPEWAQPISKIPREFADETIKGIGNLADDVDDIPDGFRLLNIGKIEKYLTPDFAGRLRNTVLRNDMAVALEKGIVGMFDVREVNSFLSKARTIMGYVRAATILPFAGYHVANKAGNMWWRYVGGTLDIRNDIDAMKLIKSAMANDRNALEKMTFNFGKKKISGLEIRNAIEQYDIASGGFLTEAAGGGPIRLGADIGDSTKWYDWINPASRKQLGSKVARGIEDSDRIAHFLGRLRKGDTMDEAARSVDTYLFRYSDLTELEAGTQASFGMMRDPLMFYTWYRKNLGLTLQKMWEYPGRLSMPIKIRNAMNDVFGNPDSEYAVPSYMRDQFYFYLGKDDEGKPRFLDPEKYLPPISAGKFSSGGLKGVGQQLGSMLVPPLKVPLEMAMGKEFFSGRDIESAQGQVVSMFGKPVSPMSSYVIKNIRILNTLNRLIFPEAELPGGKRLYAGQPGPRPPAQALPFKGVAETKSGAYLRALSREWGGFRATVTDPQRTRHMEAISEGGRIGDALNKIERKLSNPDLSGAQRNSFMNERTKLLWEKADILGEMIEDGTDPFTGKPMEWVATPAKQGEEDKGSLRQVYGELYTTLRGLYFGNVPGPLDHGIIVLDPEPRLSPDEATQTYDMLRNVTSDILKRNTEYAIENKDGSYFRNNVLYKINDLIKTEKYYSPGRIKQRKGEMPKSDIVIYNYPYDFRKSLADSYQELLKTGVRNRLIKSSSYSTMWKNFYKNYGVDYR